MNMPDEMQPEYGPNIAVQASNSFYLLKKISCLMSSHLSKLVFLECFQNNSSLKGAELFRNPKMQTFESGDC